MPRPRGFDEDEVLHRALQVFWSRGYDGATLDELEAATGLGRGSLYAAFGGKRELFLKAFERYLDEAAARGLATLAAPGAGREAIVSVFRAAAREALADRERRGCMATNCAVELASRDPDVAVRVGRNLDRLERAFEAAVRRAQAAGEIPAGRDPVRLARLLVICLQGAQVLARARPDPAWLDDAAAGVEEALGP
jgi:TetR/AcrR family transcriptional regulator, transcriptional repressor for nem operon